MNAAAMQQSRVLCPACQEPDRIPRLSRALAHLWERSDRPLREFLPPEKHGTSSATLHRLLQGSGHWTTSRRDAAFQLIAAALGCSEPQVAAYFRDDGATPNGDLAELEFCCPVPLRVERLALLGDEYLERWTHATSRLHVGRDLPWEWMPDRPLRRYARSSLIAPSIDRSGRDAAIGLGLRLRDAFMDRLETNVASAGLALVAQSAIHAVVRRTGSFGCFVAEDAADLITSMMHDAVRERGDVLGILDDERPGLPAKTRGWLAKVDGLQVLSNEWFVKRLRGAAHWLVCERSDDARQAKYFDGEVSAARSLTRHVGHPLDSKTSFDLLSRHLLKV
jgi:hypothetical protein